MFDMIRKAVMTQKINEVKDELQRAGSSLQELLMDPDILDKLDDQTAWSLIHGMEASITVLEKTLRTTLGENNEMHGDVRKTLRDVQAAVVRLKESLGSVTPMVQMVYGAPPKDSEWKLVPPGADL